MDGAHIVREFSIGNTCIKIADDYCDKSAEQTAQILSRIAKQAQRHIISAASARRENKTSQREEVRGMAYYHICPQCGAHLDPGERCDCERISDIDAQKKEPPPSNGAAYTRINVPEINKGQKNGQPAY